MPTTFGRPRSISVFSMSMLLSLGFRIGGKHNLLAAAFTATSGTQSNGWSPTTELVRVMGGSSLTRSVQSRASASSDDKTHVPNDPFVFHIETPEDMEDLGGLLATLTTAPTAIFLDGDLGAGKTALSRGYLRTATADPHLLVTSPTYLLSNMYAAAAGSRVYHMDLYRLDQKETVDEVRELLRPLNLDYIFANDVTLMEWPERLGPSFVQQGGGSGMANLAEKDDQERWPVLPPERLHIDIRIQADTVPHETSGEDIVDAQSRMVTLTPVGERWRAALKESVDEGLVDDFLLLDDDDDSDE